MYRIFYSAQARKDAKKIQRAGLKNNVLKLIELLRDNPYQSPPPYEKLLGDLLGSYSRRINIQHRLIYQIYEHEKMVKIIRMWTHYE
ncbi:MAG: Txe/YoeB family addiction module toxin [Tannerella sp.]|jgi:Txe/YoeB family toxin of toxin-antitoxin system|nr:Txe/YoeB family addiction module toxin [Tannerella sp.]